MPRAPKHCGHLGCPAKVVGRTYCVEHEPKAYSSGNVGRGRGGRPWRRQREAQFRADDWTCQWPECTHRDPTGATLECDHMDDGRLRTLCGPHHRERTLAQAVAAKRRRAGS